MNKKQKQAVMALFTVIIVLLALAGCGKKNTGKRESEIISDIKTHDYMIGDYNLNIGSSAVTKRQTNPEQKQITCGLAYLLLMQSFLIPQSIIWNMSYITMGGSWRTLKPQIPHMKQKSLKR